MALLRSLVKVGARISAASLMRAGLIPYISSALFGLRFFKIFSICSSFTCFSENFGFVFPSLLGEGL